MTKNDDRTMKGIKGNAMQVFEWSRDRIFVAKIISRFKILSYCDRSFNSLALTLSGQKYIISFKK